MIHDGHNRQLDPVARRIIRHRARQLVGRGGITEYDLTALAWQLMNARIIKYTCGPLNAKGTDVAMEEMVLAYEKLLIE